MIVKALRKSSRWFWPLVMTIEFEKLHCHHQRPDHRPDYHKRSGSGDAINTLPNAAADAPKWSCGTSRGLIGASPKVPTLRACRARQRTPLLNPRTAVTCQTRPLNNSPATARERPAAAIVKGARDG